MKKKGFTLVELMVVITIIGILAGFGFTNYTTSQKRAQDGKRKADLEQIRSALEMYRTDNLATGYPTNAQSSLVPNYLSSWPSDPKGYSYYYSRLSATSYNLCAYLEKDAPNNCGTASCGTAPGACNYKVTNP